MRITKRDLEILKFINKSGFCNRVQLEKKFDLKWWRVYQVMERLVKAQLVKHKRVLFYEPGVFYLTREGASLTDLPALDKISLGSYHHQITLTALMLRLCELYPEAEWISERQLKHQKFSKGIGQSGHVADGLLVFPEQKKVAIELELTIKGNERLKQIIKAYSKQLEIKDIWYFCSKSVFNKISTAVEKKDFIKAYPLEEFLG